MRGPENPEKKERRLSEFESITNAEVSKCVGVQNFSGGDHVSAFSAASPVVLSLIPGSPLHQVITHSSPKRSYITRLYKPVS